MVVEWAYVMIANSIQVDLVVVFEDYDIKSDYLHKPI